MDFYSYSFTALMLVAIFAAAYYGSAAAEKAFEVFWKLRSDGDAPPAGMRTLIRSAIWVLAIFFTLDNMGFEVSALLAGLGIGGVAVALASQNILGDLFNYFVIVLDKPFFRGDFIIVAEGQLGVIERIGLKTTRIRSLSGEELIIANADLMNSRIRNYKSLTERRIQFTLGLTYDAPVEKLKETPLVLKKIIEGVESTRFDRAHFARFADWALEFEVVYYVLGADYALYMDIQQKINLQVKEQLEAMGLSFAFPSRTVYLVKENQNLPPQL